MRKSAIILVLFLFTHFVGQTQTIIYSENFNGGTNTFTLNTTDLGGGGVSNQWVWNLGFPGGAFTVDCGGFPLPANVLDTPDQPAGIAGSPQSKYIHISSSAGLVAGVGNCHFVAADGFCNFSESYFAAMTSSISTVGQTNVSLSFWWLCAGLEGNSYGEVYYSTNNGTTWNPIPTAPAEFSETPNWTQQIITSPVLDNQPNLKIGFRFVTLESFDPASDPAFGIDDVSIYTAPVSNNSVSIDNVPTGPFCPGSTFQVPYTANGTFNAGNSFNIIMSNAAGSFLAPTLVGTASSTTSGTITVTIPPGTAPGTGYLLNIAATNPVTTGQPVGPITISNGPTATIDSESSTSVCSGGSAVLLYSGTPGTIQWYTSTNGINFTPIAGANTDIYTSNPITATTYFQVQVQTDCGVATSASWTVTLSNSVTIPLQTSPNTTNLCNGPITISTVGNFINLEWSSGQTGASAIVVTTPGVITVSGQDVAGCPASSAPLNIIETVPAALTVTPGNPVLFCGNPINLTAVAGFNNYQWSTGQTGPNLVITSLPAAPITVSASDNNGCNVGPVQVDVQQAGNVNVPVTPSLAAICDGEPALLTAAPGFNTYEWSNGAQGQSITVSFSGFYSVTVTDANGCEGTSAQVEVIQSQFPIANFTYTQNSGGYTINFINTSQNGETYTWLFDSLSTSPLEGPSFTFPENGPFYVTLIIENPCGIDTVTKLVVVAQVGIEEVLSAYQASVFPNPSSQDFNLTLNSQKNEKVNLIITDLQGRILSKSDVNIHGYTMVELPGDQLSKGLYLLHLQTEKGWGTLKLIKE